MDCLKCGIKLEEPRHPRDRGLCLDCYKGKTKKEEEPKKDESKCPKCNMPMRVVWLKYGDGRKVYRWSCDGCELLFPFNR